MSAARDPIAEGRGGSVLGPRNLEIESQVPDLLTPPETDNGTMPNLWFPFSAAHNRLEPGGWSREVTARELPAAKTLAGVNMHLNAGAIRELHWHKEAEWGYVFEGAVRVTAIDLEGHAFVDDVGPGDIWNFPAGYPHSIQGLREGAEFLLVFDDGTFSENSTFSIADFMAHTPREVLARNFQVSEAAFKDIPEGELYMFQGEVPGALEDDRRAVGWAGEGISFTYRLSQQAPRECPGGRVRIADSTNFPASRTIAVARVEVAPGGVREMHWHPTDDEWQYYISGAGRMTVFAANGKARTFDYRPGDVGSVPRAMGHYIENTGPDDLVLLEMFRTDKFSDISLEQWMALTPPKLLQQHLHLDESLLRSLRRQKPIVAG
jgi:oxalate decarboxylase